MLPGFGGSADQPILLALETALGARGLSSVRASLTAGRASPGLQHELDQARTLLRGDPAIAAYAGRSFGGRVLARLALETKPRALVLLGFPIRSQTGRRRLEDERVLATLPCPTLVVQGARDPLGPLRTLERIWVINARLVSGVLVGATHAFGRRERQAVETAADWLAARLC